MKRKTTAAESKCIPELQICLTNCTKLHLYVYDITTMGRTIDFKTTCDNIRNNLFQNAWQNQDYKPTEIILLIFKPILRTSVSRHMKVHEGQRSE